MLELYLSNVKYPITLCQNHSYVAGNYYRKQDYNVDDSCAYCNYLQTQSIDVSSVFYSMYSWLKQVHSGGSIISINWGAETLAKLQYGTKKTKLRLVFNPGKCTIYYRGRQKTFIMEDK